MNNKQSKKFRKQIRKECKQLGKNGYGKAMFTISRQRDWITLISIGLFILLCASVYFNLRWYF